MRVILVEDHPLVRQLEAEILSNLGYEVAATASAEEALQSLDVERAAILITDIRLPGVWMESPWRGLHDNVSVT